MSDLKIMLTCFTCHRKFQHGPHRYDGQVIKAYDIIVCGTCFASNWDGWTPHFGDPIIAHLKANGIPIPTMNEKGFLPRGD